MVDMQRPGGSPPGLGLKPGKGAPGLRGTGEKRMSDTPVHQYLNPEEVELHHLRAEVERLGRDYETARDAHDRRVRELDAHCAEVARLREEVERLRAALEKIASMEGTCAATEARAVLTQERTDDR